MCYHPAVRDTRVRRRGPRPARKPSYLTDMLVCLTLGLLAAAWIAPHHQPRTRLLAGAVLALLLFLALMAFRRSRRRARPPAVSRPRPQSRYPPRSWPEQPPATRLIPAQPPSADFDYWQPAHRRTVINALDAGQLAEVADYMASLDPELFGQAVRSLDEEALPADECLLVSLGVTKRGPVLGRGQTSLVAAH
jgi:hypothetical protein